MADEKTKAAESVLPGDQPPTNEDGTLKVDTAAQKATEKNEAAAAKGEANTGLSASTNPNPLPAGEMRPSVDVPSLLPPVAGVAADPSDAGAGGKLLQVEQDLAWLIEHQPSGLLVSLVPELRALHARVQQERHRDKPNTDLVDQVKLKLATCGVAPEALPSGRKD